MAINCTFELINEKIYNKIIINYDDFINFCNSSFKINDADYYFIFYDGMEKYIIKNKEDYKKSIKSLFQKKKKLNIKNFFLYEIYLKNGIRSRFRKNKRING